MLLNMNILTRMCAIVALVMGTTMPVAQAEGTQQPAVSNAKWKDECGACHVAYPPHMLHAESWRAIMAGLDKHFGSNAGLDAATAGEITAFLENNARSKGRAPSGKPLLRITETPWFKSEHREVAARDWKNSKVKSPANCGACHTQADRGDFSEDNVKIPK